MNCDSLCVSANNNSGYNSSLSRALSPTWCGKSERAYCGIKGLSTDLVGAWNTDSCCNN